MAKSLPKSSSTTQKFKTDRSRKASPAITHKHKLLNVAVDSGVESAGLETNMMSNEPAIIKVCSVEQNDGLDSGQEVALLPEQVSPPELNADSTAVFDDAQSNKPITLKPTSKPTKLAELINFLQRPDGATLMELCAATGWQTHSVRGALAGALKHKGFVVTSAIIDGSRRYRIGAAV